MEDEMTRKGSFNTRLKAWEVIAGIIMIGLVVLAPLSCASPSGDAVKLEGVTWVLQSYGDTANPAEAITGHEPTLTFDKEKMKISGNNGVNVYGGDYAVDGTSLSISQMMQTLMASANPALNSQETAFMKILSSATSFNIKNNQLTLTGSEGTLVFLQK
jgi:heat shock protein HslJ